ncbi:BlaI/MecI/CopY family transcriptional regulator [Ruania albidiflava]|uniref:BlaI/MecI/CopY family transcriptional regulator n=1 Tax=Ruania albidiflava TaxID=366586 RepID=UPI0003B5DAF9|nr:BlaI/MecI/CopY family transcriptional regulator [Ruania albidiflava]
MGRRARGELEAQVLGVLWEQSEPVSAGVIQEQLPGPAAAYTTVLTVLDRLEKKGEVLRSGDSPRKVRFRAARSGDEHTSSTMIDALDGARDRQAALLQFAGNLSDGDVAVLQQALTGKKR